MNESVRVLVALIVALVVGAAIAASGNTTLLEAADIVSPIGTVWVNAIRMTVIPLIVSLLITGVASANDGKTIGRIGGRALLVFGLLLVGTALIVVPVLPLVFGLLPRGTGALPPMPQGAAEAAGQIAASGPGQSLGAWIVSLVPANPIAAAASGAIVPLIVFTLLLGLAIAHTPATSRSALVGFFKALGDALLVLVRWVIAAAPIGVFALVLPLAAHLGAGLAGAVGFYIAVYAGTSLSISAAAVSRGCHCRARTRGAIRPCGASVAAHRGQLELLDGVAAGARGGSGGVRPVESCDGVRVAARGVDVQDCRAGVVDGGRAFRRVVLRNSPWAARARDDCGRVDLPSVHWAGRSARGVPHARAALRLHWSSGRGDRDTHCGRRDSGRVQHGAQCHGRPRSRGDHSAR